MAERLKVLVPLLLLLILLPALVLSIKFRQLLFPRATGETLAGVRIHPGEIVSATPSGTPVYLSALAYDTTGRSLFNGVGVTYEWGISSSGSIGTLEAHNEIATFTPTGTGNGILWVTARTDTGRATGYARVCWGVLCPEPSPVPSPVTNHPIWWETTAAVLRAGDFYIDTNGQRFFGVPDSGTTLRLGSDPPHGTNPGYTTLEATWTEHGVEMRLNIYFERTGGVWRAYEIRTYNGQAPGDWVYYDFPGAGSAIGTPTTTIGDWDFVNTPQSRYSGRLHLNTVYLQGFLTSSLSFRTALQGISGRRGPDQVVTVALTPAIDSSSGVAHDVTVVSDASGTYFGYFGADLTPGTYDILVTGPAHLRRRFASYHLAPGDNLVDLSSVPLLAGDFDKNNDITILDIGEILSQYVALSIPATPVNTLYDVNKDGTIDITDIGLVLSNYTALSNPGD